MPCLIMIPIVCSAIAEEPLPTVAELRCKVRSTLEHRSTLSLTAHVQRAWRTRDGRSGLKQYRVEAKMAGDTIRTRVFDPETGAEAARADRKGDEDEKITPIGEKEPDGCLFGTLTESWIGLMAVKSTFVERLARPECRLVGVEPVGTTPCHKVVHRYRIFDDGDQSEWVGQTLHFDIESSLPLRWTSQSREGPTWREGFRFMEVTRTYIYSEPATHGTSAELHSVATVDDGGAHLSR